MCLHIISWKNNEFAVYTGNIFIDISITIWIRKNSNTYKYEIRYPGQEEIPMSWEEETSLTLTQKLPIVCIYDPYLAPLDMWAFVITCHLASVNNLHYNRLLWKLLAYPNQTLMEWSPFQFLYGVSKNDKNGRGKTIETFYTHFLSGTGNFFYKKVFLREKIGPYGKCIKKSFRTTFTVRTNLWMVIS